MCGYVGIPHLGPVGLLPLLLVVPIAGAPSSQNHALPGQIFDSRTSTLSRNGYISGSGIHRGLQTCTATDGFTVTSEAFPLMEGCFEAKEAIPTEDPSSTVMYYASAAAHFQAVFEAGLGYRWYADYFEGGIAASSDELVHACRTIENTGLDLQPADESLTYECDLDGDGVFESSPITDDVFSVTCGCDDADTARSSPAPSAPVYSAAPESITHPPQPSPAPSGRGAGVTTPGPFDVTGAPTAEGTTTGSGWTFSMAPTTDFTAAPTSGSRDYQSPEATGSPTSFTLPPATIEHHATPSPGGDDPTSPRGIASTSPPEGAASPPSDTPSPTGVGLTDPRGIESTIAPEEGTGPPSAAGSDGGSSFSVAPTGVVAETGAPTAGAPRDFGSIAPASSSDTFTTSASSKSFARGLITLMATLTSMFAMVAMLSD